MTDCLDNQVGLKSMCRNADKGPMFYVDDIEGISQDTLSRLATVKDGSGSKLFTSISESAQRLMLADIESIIPPTFTIKQEAASVCSACEFGVFSQTSATGIGIIIKNTSNSRFSSMVVRSVRVKTATTGRYTLMVGALAIEQDFVAGEELEIKGINYMPDGNSLKIYFLDPTLALYTVECDKIADCGCSGSPKSINQAIITTGYMNGVESNIQYGILACVDILCGRDNVICTMVAASPRLFAVSLLYLTASKIFEQNVMSERINETASTDIEAKTLLSQHYYNLYRERLVGNPSKNILGLAQVLNQNLRNTKDICIECSSPLDIAWAVG